MKRSSGLEFTILRPLRKVENYTDLLNFSNLVNLNSLIIKRIKFIKSLRLVNWGFQSGLNFGLNTKIRFGKKGNTIWFYNFAYEFSEKYDVDFKDDPSVFGEYRSKNASFRTGISFRF